MKGYIQYTARWFVVLSQNVYTLESMHFTLYRIPWDDRRPVEVVSRTHNRDRKPLPSHSSKKEMLRDGESNPGLPRDRRGY